MTLSIAIAAVGAALGEWALGQEGGTEDLSPEGAASSAEKEAIVKAEEKWREAGQTNQPPPESRPEHSPPTYEPQEWPEGIFGSEEADFPAGLNYEFENIWRGTSGDGWIVVHAGALRDDESVGVLLVLEINPRTGAQDFETVKTPVPGPVNITAAEGHILTVKSLATSDSIEFSVDTLAFSPAGT